MNVSYLRENAVAKSTVILDRVKKICARAFDKDVVIDRR